MNPRSTLPPALDGERFLLDVGGVRVVGYRGLPDLAAGAADDARPLILIHSVNAAASAFEVRPLFDHYRRSRPVYAIDLPGYGWSDRSDRFYSPRLMTDAVLALAELVGTRHGDACIDGIAVSLSCEYLARAVVEAPQRWCSVGLVSATGLSGTRLREGAPGSTRGRAALLRVFGRAPWSAALFRGLTKPAVIRYFLRKTWGSSHIDEGLLAYDVMTAREPGAAFAPFHFLSGYLFSADITRIYDRLTALAIPTLLVHGTRGDFVDYRGAARFVRPGGWSRHVMRTGALPYFEDLADFVATYEAFLAKG